MVKKSKLATPEWILEGYDSEEEYNKKKGVKKEKKKDGHRSVSPKALNAGRKTFKIRECPKCGSDEVGVVLSGIDLEEESGTGQEWECRKCKWKGEDIVKKELNEEELMKYLDEKGEEVI